MPNILGLIPARGGSKGIPRKNITLVAGKPLIAYTIQAAQASQHLSRVMVSTDDAEIAEVAQSYGAEVPFLRPPHLAEDTTPALPVIQHLLQKLKDDEHWQADMIVYLQPTSPLRQTQQIDAAIELLLEKNADTVVSVVEVPHHFHPLSVMRLTEEGLESFLPEGKTILRRQDKPTLYARNGPAVLAMTYQTVMEQHTLYGKRTLPLVMDAASSLDIDTPLDLRLAELFLSLNE